MSIELIYTLAVAMTVAGAGLIYFLLSKNERFWPAGTFQWVSAGASLAVSFCGIAVLLVAAQTDVSYRSSAIVSSSEIIEMDLMQPSENFSFKLVSNEWDSQLDVYRGKVVLVNVWATWCAPCLDEIPALNKLQNKYGDQGLVVLSISDEPRDALINFQEQLPMSTVSGFVEQTDLLPPTIKTAFEARPTTYVVDRDGNLRKYVLGARNFSYFEQLVQPYL